MYFYICKIYIFFFLEILTRGHFHWFERESRGDKERERNTDVREKPRSVPYHTWPDLGVRPAPRAVPWLGTEPTTFRLWLWDTAPASGATGPGLHALGQDNYSTNSEHSRIWRGETSTLYSNGQNTSTIPPWALVYAWYLGTSLNICAERHTGKHQVNQNGTPRKQCSGNP